jgi:multidrug resistance efflux pump
MRRKSIIVFGIILAGVAAGLGFYWPFAKRPAGLRLPGIVEIQEVHLGPRVAGRVKEVLVREGDHVKPNDVVLRLEVPELEAQREALRAKLRQAQAELDKAENGPRKEEKEAARHALAAARARLKKAETGNREEEKRLALYELESARADHKLATKDFQRVQRLVRPVAATRAEYDAAVATLNRARRRLDMAQAKYDLVMAGTRAEEIDEARAEVKRLEASLQLLEEGTRYEDRAAARAAVAEVQARLHEVEVQIAEATVRAPEAAVVQVVPVRKGSLVTANQPVVRVLRTADLWVKIYVPETELGKVRLGQAVTVKVDGYPDRTFEGKVTHIGAESEFTPRNVQSVDERRHQVFGIRVQIADPQGVFKSGMAAEVTVPLQE